MAVSAVTAGGTGTVQSSSQSLAANFDNFLKLLTTQLQNQDPLALMDANAFTSQLVQFASVEQAIKTNDKLTELGGLIETSGMSSAMSMLGREAVVATDRVGLGATGDATIRYRLPEAGAKVTAARDAALGGPAQGTDRCGRSGRCPRPRRGMPPLFSVGGGVHVLGAGDLAPWARCLARDAAAGVPGGLSPPR
jgi:flagellar basal-body rod modification protein FlgD